MKNIIPLNEILDSLPSNIFSNFISHVKLLQEISQQQSLIIYLDF